MDLLNILLRASLRPVLRIGAVTMTCIVLLVAWMPAGDCAAASLEYPVKAAFLSKFGIYVEWPPGTFPTQLSPLVLCIAGGDPFGEALDRATADQRIEGHPVLVKRLRTVTRDAGCHILYLGYNDSQNTDRALNAVRGKPVLTVVEANNADDGMIRFVISDNRVRFDIDEVEAAQSGLKISSKLLGLALNVRTR